MLDTVGPGKKATLTAMFSCRLRLLCLCLQAGAAHTLLAQQGDTPGAGALQLPSHAAVRASCHGPHVWVCWVWAGVQWGWPVLPRELVGYRLLGLSGGSCDPQSTAAMAAMALRTAQLEQQTGRLGSTGSSACTMLSPGLLHSSNGLATHLMRTKLSILLLLAAHHLAS